MQLLPHWLSGTVKVAAGGSRPPPGAAATSAAAEVSPGSTAEADAGADGESDVPLGVALTGCGDGAVVAAEAGVAVVPPGTLGAEVVELLAFAVAAGDPAGAAGALMLGRLSAGVAAVAGVELGAGSAIDAAFSLTVELGTSVTAGNAPLLTTADADGDAPAEIEPPDDDVTASLGGGEDTALVVAGATGLAAGGDTAGPLEALPAAPAGAP